MPEAQLIGDANGLRCPIRRRRNMSYEHNVMVYHVHRERRRLADLVSLVVSCLHMGPLVGPCCCSAYLLRMLRNFGSRLCFGIVNYCRTGVKLVACVRPRGFEPFPLHRQLVAHLWRENNRTEFACRECIPAVSLSGQTATTSLPSVW